jgi:hypothetical protein
MLREPVDQTKGAGPEAERQLAAAVERHREVLASMQELGRPEAGQHVAVKAVGRAVHLVTFALARAAESGVPLERLVELTGWEPRLVSDALARGSEPSLVARLAPPGLDPDAVAQSAAIIEATARLRALTQRIVADVDDDAWSPALADLNALYARLDSEWKAWRQTLGEDRTCH